MKILNLALAILFLISAGLQLNDPDPWLWTLLYLSIAVICVFAAFGRYNRWVILLVMAVCIYELSGLLPDFKAWLKEGMPSITESMKASSPHVELVREFLGVAICMIVLVFQYIRCRLVTLRQE